MKKTAAIPILAAACVLIGGFFVLQKQKVGKSNQEFEITNQTSTMILSSPAFANNGDIPAKFTCDGDMVSPPLSINWIPQNAESLVLIVDDPDAPSGTFIHWITWNIVPTLKEIKENATPDGAMQGVNSAGGNGYAAPCPPKGDKPHRYFFKIYALDTMLDLPSVATINDLAQAMEKHVLDKAEMIGKYKR